MEELAYRLVSHHSHPHMDNSQDTGQVLANEPFQGKPLVSQKFVSLGEPSFWTRPPHQDMCIAEDLGVHSSAQIQLVVGQLSGPQASLLTISKQGQHPEDICMSIDIYRPRRSMCIAGKDIKGDHCNQTLLVHARMHAHTQLSYKKGWGTDSNCNHYTRQQNTHVPSVTATLKGCQPSTK